MMLRSLLAEQVGMQDRATVLDGILDRLEAGHERNERQKATLLQHAALLLALEAERIQCRERGQGDPDPVEWINHALHRLQAQLLAQELKKRYESASLCHTASAKGRMSRGQEGSIRPTGPETVDLVRSFRTLLERVRSHRSQPDAYSKPQSQ